MYIYIHTYIYIHIYTTYAHTSVPTYSLYVTIEQPPIKAGDIGLCVREYRRPGCSGAASNWGSVSGH